MRGLSGPATARQADSPGAQASERGTSRLSAVWARNVFTVLLLSSKRRQTLALSPAGRSSPAAPGRTF